MGNTGNRLVLPVPLPMDLEATLRSVALSGWRVAILTPAPFGIKHPSMTAFWTVLEVLDMGKAVVGGAAMG